MPIFKLSTITRNLSVRLVASFVICICTLLFAEQTSAQVGTWAPVATHAPDANNGVLLQMSDGSILCHTSSGAATGQQAMGDGTIWDKLTPDSTGHYIHGTWTNGMAAMHQERFSFSSAVLKNGNVYAAGGEYGTDGTQAGYHGEVYNFTANTWTEITGSTVQNVISDGSCKILDNGNILQGLVDVSFPVDNVFFNPATNAYSAAPSTRLNNATNAIDSFGTNESMWLKLPDNSILFVDEDQQTSERYIPSLNIFVRDANLPVSLYDTYGYECGPAWMLPDGRAFFIGGTQHTAFYTPSGTTAPGTWAAGPDVPSDYGMPDAPGVMMVNGKILFACEPIGTSAQNEFLTPTKFYEFDYLTNAYTAVTPPGTASANSLSQNYSLLGLADGTVLCGLSGDNTSQQYYIYTPVGAPLAAGQPVISTVTPLTCTTYMVTGHGFNGISEGSAFGDENECDSNYPLFRFTSGGKVYYARSYNWNSTGVQRGLKPDTAYFTLPATMSSGNYYMYAVANGIASDSVLFIDATPSLSSSLTPAPICTGTAFTYTPTSTTVGATFTWTRAAVTGISNAAITTPQTVNPNEVLVNTTLDPVTVTYTYSVTGTGCSNIQSVNVVVNPTRPIPSFTAGPTSACYLPDSVTFTNTSIAASTYTWYFGDATTSTAVNPVHPYLAGGTYTVKLVASGCETDSITQVNLITISPPAAPVATSPVNISCGGRATLSATGTDSLKWFNQASGGTVLATGTSYTTPVLGGNTTFYVANYVGGTASFCPPLAYSFGTGSNYANNNFRSDVFNVNQACTLVSVEVNSSGAGNRTIQLTDSTGVNVLQTATINIPTGVSTVTLNFPLTVGTNYQLGCGDGVTTTNLWRNETGAAFPYSDPSGYITITGNNVPDAVHFYFFYDWKLQGPSCVSARTPVLVNISNNGLTLSPSITPVSCFGGNNGAATLTTSGGTPGYTYNWSNGQSTATLSGVAAGNYNVTVSDAGGCSTTAAETIGQPAVLAVSVTPIGASCGASTGSATAAASGGTSAYTYLWSNAATTATVLNLAPTNYTLTVTDAHSCTATATTTITSSGGLNLTLSGVDVACSGGATGSATVTLTGGTGTISYHWSNGGTAATISNVTAATYTVTVSETGGCSGTSTQTVSQPGPLNVSSSATNSGCGSPNGTATATATGGTVSYSYLWSNAATTAVISNLSAATYNVTVIDNHQCTATTSAVVSNSGQLNLSAVPNTTNCSGSSTGGAAVAVNGGTAPFTYTWSNGTTTASISGVTAATYTVTVSDNTGCSGTSSVTVSLGAAIALTPATTNVNCFNAGNGSASVNVTSGTSPFAYTWNNGSTASSITNVTAGNYYVTVTDARSCVAIDTLVVSQPASITIFVTEVQPTCVGLNDGSASVTATGGTPSYTFNWSTNTSGTSVNSLAPGSYSVTLTDANSCTSVSTFSITNPVPVSASIAAQSDSCFGSNDGNIQVTAAGGTSPYSYLWSDSITAPSINNLAAGTYTVTITDVHNCSATLSASITQPTQIVVPTSTTNATNTLSNGSASVGTISGGNGPYTLAWSNTQTSNTISNLAAGTYTVTVTDHNGCQTVATAIVNQGVGIATVNSELIFTLYPNPATTEITVDAGTLDKQTTLLLEDILGQTIMAKEVTATPVTIDVTGYANGVYFIELQQDGKSAVKKFVINR